MLYDNNERLLYDNNETNEILILIQNIGYSIEYECNKLKEENIKLKEELIKIKEEKQKLINTFKKYLIN
jgi:hypothetical protein